MGEDISIESIYSQFQDKVSRYVRSRLSSPQDAEDLVSDIFVKVSASIGRYDRGCGSISTWIYAITRNAVRDHFRRRRPSLNLDEQENLPDEGVTVEEEVITRENLSSLALALGALSQRERDIIILRYYQGLSPGEIARRMQISYTNCGYIQSTALKKLRALLNGSMEDKPKETPTQSPKNRRQPRING